MADTTELSKENQGDHKPKVPRHRSPNYPAFSLRKAVERAKEVYETYKQVQVPIKTIHARWNYEAMSGLVLQTVAALKAYGLVDVSGDKDARMVRLTDAAVRIIRDHPDRERLLKGAALNPSVYAELWKKCTADGVPPDDILAHCLEWEMHFNPNAIDGLIKDFRDTIAFAKLTPADIMGGGGNGNGGEDDDSLDVGDGKPPAKPAPETQPPKRAELPKGGPDMSTDTLTLDVGIATLQCPRELSPEDYHDLEDWIGIQLRRIKRRIKVDPGDNEEEATQ